MPAKLVESRQIVTPETAGAAQGLVRALTGLPNATVRGLFGHGCVQVDGEPCWVPGDVVPAGAELQVRYDPARKYRERSKERPNRAFRMVFEDAHLMVVNKSPGVLTEPNKGESDTLVDYLAVYLNRGRRSKEKPWTIHRLDRATSGLLVFGKRQGPADAIRAQFRERKPERVYYAVAAGDVRPPSGTFRSHLTTDASLNQYSTRVPGQGQLAITHYQVLHRVQGATVVKVQLETGRRNQIRVHFAEAGHPLLGDPRYGGAKTNHPLWKARHVALHGAVLGFKHPHTGEQLRFEAELPPEFAPYFPAGLPALGSIPTPGSAPQPGYVGRPGGSPVSERRPVRGSTEQGDHAGQPSSGAPPVAPRRTPKSPRRQKSVQPPKPLPPLKSSQALRPPARRASPKRAK